MNHKVVVLGATGLLGSAAFQILSEAPDLDVYGTSRSDLFTSQFPKKLQKNLLLLPQVSLVQAVESVLASHKPQFLLNCVSPPRELLRSHTVADVEECAFLLACLPRLLDRLCAQKNCKLIHVSSDGIFSGGVGNYSEDYVPEINSFYGKLKFLGEPSDSNSVTLRTSFIGREISGKKGFLEWFLSGTAPCDGYIDYFFSGLTSVELSMIIRDYVLRNPLSGVYHVAGPRISKFNLMASIREVYGVERVVTPNQNGWVDRSLDASRFYRETGYRQKDWVTMLTEAKAFEEAAMTYS